jgi:GT2 family glycosyltransferase
LLTVPNNKSYDADTPFEVIYPTVTAVVLNYNGGDNTVACIDSLLKSGYPSLKIVLVDNASTDGSQYSIKNTFLDIPFIQRETNGGYAVGNNDGIRYALANGSDYVLIINNDVTVTPGFLRPMVRIAENDTSVGIVTCKAYLSSNGDKIYTTAGNYSKMQGTVIPLRKYQRELQQSVDFISGCILLIKKMVFETIGYFNEQYFMYYEDLEFSQRVKQAYKLIYTPQAVVYHKSGGGEKFKSYTALYLYYYTRNRIWFVKNNSIFYRVYIYGYSLVNSIFKSVIIILNQRNPRYIESCKIKLAALWKGLFDGLKIN